MSVAKALQSTRLRSPTTRGDHPESRSHLPNLTGSSRTWNRVFGGVGGRTRGRCRARRPEPKQPVAMIHSTTKSSQIAVPSSLRSAFDSSGRVDLNPNPFAFDQLRFSPIVKTISRPRERFLRSFASTSSRHVSSFSRCSQVEIDRSVVRERENVDRRASNGRRNL